ncbi:smalltalk protein [Oscillospiraceae bacterium N12]|uniref:Smalltalk protein n=1 Tax=Jilunia laotingensis TaxID=2763675 RepID=A0A926F8E9_9BACT|nr:smalltalk protein [Jilunia laotingensis]MBC8593992.1 smalltalk protein [Jilunia laotingensis]
MKKTLWNTILKVVIAIASALAGVFGGQAIMA